MRFYIRYCVIVIIFISQIGLHTSEIITASLVGGALIGGFFGWNSIKSNTICRYVECCDEKHIPYDIEKLKASFEQKMYGQPLVNELISILRAHKMAISDANKSNQKALVLSLHGWSGVGKNHAATLIAEAIYKEGVKSNYVKIFMGKKDFDCTDINKAQKILREKVNSVVKRCSKALIIFDEIHEMCASVLDAIKPMLDHHHEVDGVDYRNSIFIFISNIGGSEIATKLLELYTSGVKRSEVEFQNFEPIIRRVAYNTGGFEKFAAIAHHLIDHYIPFLPLEQHHAEMCALAEFRLNGVSHPTEEMMASAMSVVTYGPTEDHPIFANNGCKRFNKQIPYIIEKQKDEL